MSNRRSRKLRLVLGRSPGTLPALLAATLLPAGASCSSTAVVDGQPSGGSDAGVGGSGGASSGFGGMTSSGTGGQGASGECAGWQMEETFEVEVPPDGVLASPAAICAVNPPPVESNKAARVTLNKYSQSLHLATGFVEVEPTVLTEVVGLPTVEVVEAWEQQLTGMQVTQMAPTNGGFSFQAEWPQPFVVLPEPWSRMTVKTTFDINCNPQGSATVEAITHIHLCVETGELTWVSSGDQCTACSTVCEMAPSPIVPAAGDDALPLARVLRLRVTALARVGRKLVLLAESDGGAGLHYDWRPSGGQIAELAPDVIVWTLPDEPGPHLVQVAVHGSHAVAVASLRTDRAA